MWYYLCKNRKLVSGHKCTYKKHIRQDQINAEALAIIKKAMSDEAYKKKVFTTIGDTSVIEELEETLKRLRERKKELSKRKEALQNQVKNLNADDMSYEFKFDMIMQSVDELYTEIKEIQNNIQKNESKILNAKRTRVSAEVFFKEFQEQVEHLDEKTDVELKKIANEFISEIHLYPEQKEEAHHKGKLLLSPAKGSGSLSLLIGRTACYAFCRITCTKS